MCAFDRSIDMSGTRFTRLCFKLTLLSGAKLFDNSRELAGPFSTREEHSFPGLSATKNAKNFSLFFLGLDDDVPLVRTVFLAARWRSADFGKCELPLSGPVAENTLVNEEQNSTVADLKQKKKV